jgi:hypothetical protein
MSVAAVWGAYNGGALRRNHVAMTSWAAKDPDAVLDYVYRIALDAGDSVATHSLAVLSGTVSIDSESIAAAPDTTDEGYGQDVTVWLSGGAAGETAVFRIAWITTDTRENDDVITLPVIESDIVPLVLTGYAKPAPADLLTRYPAFADVPVATIAYWLADAERYVTDAWTEGDYAAGLMALAAHNMALAGYGTEAAALSGIPNGVSRFKSGALEVNFTDAAANARVGGDLTSTRYGVEYQSLLARNRGGPLVAPTGVPPDGVYPEVWP